MSEPGPSGKSERARSKRAAGKPARVLCRHAVLAAIAGLLARAPAAVAAEAFAGYAWGYSDNEDGPSLVLGSTETTEDFVFLFSCSNADKSAEMTVYVDIEGAKVDQPVTIELTRDGAKASVKGTTTTDEMSGFIFAEAKDFPVKLVVAVLDGKGPVTVVTGKTVTRQMEDAHIREGERPPWAAHPTPATEIRHESQRSDASVAFSEDHLCR